MPWDIFGNDYFDSKLNYGKYMAKFGLKGIPNLV